MQIASVIAEPAGWAPQLPPQLAPSTRPSGLLRGGLAAWRGIPELAAGIALSGVQVALLAPLLAAAASMSEAAVRADLEQVRVQVGGLAAGAGNVATTIGHHVYVSDAARAAQMLSWSSRGWLAHELGHTLQWRRAGGSDRTFLNRYVGAYARHDGSFGAGGFAQAFAELVRRRRAGEPVGPVGDLIHDTHPMERDAERIATAVRDATRPGI
ncbi:MAG: hypothetical protein JWM86_1926 [Thermoleophilia bacterium]|nr:hypothetical protein [Thermoleophilia bacterium]